ncbi:MAG TPA: flagellar basal body L-ring protein FlgH [Candidatus Binataceae bacterium]|nr:flagellar basal body L-ring protein FlgH [Candidatus Binataceae bacterium]
MKLKPLAGAALLAFSASGCAALPFIPTAASVAMKFWPSHQSVSPINPGSNQLEKDDPAIEKAIATPPKVIGDNGVTIGQQDRVSFQPEAEGSIPVRVAAIDLVSDVKARSVGDIVTVNVSEVISSEAKAVTSLSNKRSLSGGIPNLFMGTESLAAHNPLLNLSSMINSSSQNSTDGSGDMTAADNFSATVSTVVVAVNPSGTLSVKGDRRVQINGENDTIHLSGVVRPQDIDSYNTVASSQVADLVISMSGSGQIRDKQGDGLGTRVFDWVWPF